MEAGKIRNLLKKTQLIMLIPLLMLSACTASPEKNGPNESQNENIQENNGGTTMPQPQDISLRASDGVILKASFYDNNKSSKGLILLHQFSKDRSSWKPWLQEWQKTHKVIAIDLRGHGESSLKFSDFTDEDFNSMIKDAEAAAEFLGRKEVKAEAISIIGASIGANTAQNYASTHLVDKVVLLSPGLTYKGIKLSMKDNTALIIASTEDTYSFQSVKELEKNSPTSEFLYLTNKGHGTNMLDKELTEKIANYLSE